MTDAPRLSREVAADFGKALAILEPGGTCPLTVMVLKGLLAGAKTLRRALKIPRACGADGRVAARRARDDLIRGYADTYCAEIPNSKRAEAVAARFYRYLTSKWSVDKLATRVPATLAGDDRSALHQIFAAAASDKVPTSAKQVGRILGQSKKTF